MVHCQAGADRLSNKGARAKGQDTWEQVALAAESAPRRRGPILLQFWKENFDSAYPLLDLQNTLLNGREAAV